MGYWKNDIDGNPVWDFTPQPDVWGYLNNPRWTDSPEDGASHNYTGRESEEPQLFTPPDRSWINECKDQGAWEI